MTLAAAGFADAEPSPSDPESEYKVKALYLLGFAQFVQWPAQAFPEPDSPLIIGILGHEPAREALERELQGTSAQGRQVEVRSIEQIAEVDHCHVLFITWDQRRQARLLEELEGKPVLTVGESVKFLRDGGSIQLVLVDDHLRFDVDWEATLRAGLKISSRMLKAARKVYHPPTQGGKD